MPRNNQELREKGNLGAPERKTTSLGDLAHLRARIPRGRGERSGGRGIQGNEAARSERIGGLQSRTSSKRHGLARLGRPAMMAGGQDWAAAGLAWGRAAWRWGKRPPGR